MLAEHLARIVAKPERRIVGLMSGTSLDGIDAALVVVRGAGSDCGATLERFLCVPYERDLRVRLLLAAAGEPLLAAEHARLHYQVGDAFARAALAVIAAAGSAPGDVDAIGMHGQTLFHQATGRGAWSADEATWQAGCLPLVAARTGILTVGDFRSADVALGGTGAPLVPYVDWLLRRSDRESRVLLNVGGIANITYLRARGAPGDVLAWDVGPGNMVMDGLARELLGQDCDRDGAHAALGRANAGLVGELLEDEFFRRPAPKSAGREQFGAAYVERLLAAGRRHGLGTEDLLATATELTARAVALVRGRPPLAGARLDALYVSGGGRHNATLLQRLASLLAPVPVHGLEVLGVDPDAKEALDFAILANETLHGHAANLPRVTGASRPCILGALSLAGQAPRPLRIDAS